MTLQTEIFEQTKVLGELLENQHDHIEQTTRALRQLDISYVFLAARGTSDNAGRYANYLWGSFNQLPVALATPSLFTFYQSPPKLKKALVVGISQSGQSPDIVSVLEEGRRQGCPTLAITNAADSRLAAAADYVIDICAGEEHAVAATKSYSAQLLAIAMLSASLSGDQERLKALQDIPKWVSQALKLDENITSLTERYRFMSRCVVIGRGYNYATAFEWSLKLKELCYIVAEPYSSADFLHGPIAMIEHGFPVFIVAPSGGVFEDLLELAKRLRRELNADLLVVSDQEKALEIAQSPIRLPRSVPEWLSPIVAIIPAQLLAYHLTISKGFNTETPRSIQKVTETH